MARQGMAWRGMARQAWQGKAGLGMVRQAGHGEVWSGKAGQGEACQGRRGISMPKRKEVIMCQFISGN